MWTRVVFVAGHESEIRIPVTGQEKRMKKSVTPPGFEPGTSRLMIRRSNQLSYAAESAGSARCNL